MIPWSLVRSIEPSLVMRYEDVVGLHDHLRAVPQEEQELVERYLQAAESAIEKELSRSLLDQRWILYLDRFPSCTRGIAYPGAIGLPRPTIGDGPSLSQVVSVQYVDADGTTQTLSTSLWDECLTGQPAGYVYPAYGTSWPITRDVPHAVTITYEAGLDDAQAVPAEVKVAIAQLTASLYEHRESTITGTIVNQMPEIVRLLANHRSYWEPAYA